jgi:sugar lactone lactonase YvrE
VDLVVVKGGPKLVRIDLATNEVAHVFSFDEDLAPQGSYLNDVRFSPDGGFAYITDSDQPPSQKRTLWCTRTACRSDGPTDAAPSSPPTEASWSP